ncbi:MAG: hypothetical protein CM15mP8_0370 [Methanobacteriota archaeon]|nr:MAG: hypothetical protein CM15mP8_0370 [Euryarchaeota archaeon]
MILGPGFGGTQDSELTWKAELAVNGGIEIPLLGICLGHQGDWFSGRLWVNPTTPMEPFPGNPVKCKNDGSGLFQTSSKNRPLFRYNSLLIKEAQNYLSLMPLMNMVQ